VLELQLAGWSGEQIREQPSSRKSGTSVPLKPSTAVLRPVERQIWTGRRVMDQARTGDTSLIRRSHGRDVRIAPSGQAPRATTISRNGFRDPVWCTARCTYRPRLRADGCRHERNGARWKSVNQGRPGTPKHARPTTVKPSDGSRTQVRILPPPPEFELNAGLEDPSASYRRVRPSSRLKHSWLASKLTSEYRAATLGVPPTRSPDRSRSAAPQRG